MARETLHAAKYFGFNDVQVSFGRNAAQPGASGSLHQPDVAVQADGKLHLIFMQAWGQAATASAVSAVAERLADIRAVDPARTCTAVLFAKEPVAPHLIRLGDTLGVWVLAPPHCRGYAHFLVHALLGPDGPWQVAAASRRSMVGHPEQHGAPDFQLRAVCFDWGGTLMSEQGPQDRPMALWPTVHTLDEAVETLAALHQTHVVCIATNATMSRQAMVEKALARGGLRDHIDHVFTHTELGLRKESPDFWASVLKRLQLAPHQVAMVGDTLEPDVFSPARCGLMSIWFNEGGRRTLDAAQAGRVRHQVTRLPDLLPLIRAAS